MASAATSWANWSASRSMPRIRLWKPRRSFIFSSSSPILVRNTSACSGTAFASRPMRAIFADQSVCQAPSRVSAAWSETCAASRSVRAAASLVSSLDRFCARSSRRLMASSACSRISVSFEPESAEGSPASR